MPGVHPSFRNCGFRDLAVLLHSRFNAKAKSRERALRRKNRKSSKAKSFFSNNARRFVQPTLTRGYFLNKKKGNLSATQNWKVVAIGSLVMDMLAAEMSNCFSLLYQVVNCILFSDVVCSKMVDIPIFFFYRNIK